MKGKIYTIDLTKIEGDGSFPCPSCGVVISPEDETEKIYTILEAKAEENSLNEITLKCQKCKAKIRLVGFEVPSA